MVRVYVLGGGGSGKTTLGKLLGARLGCPAVHLDVHLDAAFFFPGWSAMPEDELCAAREARIRELAARDVWVIEGNFPGWIDEFAAVADLIVWLDIPFGAAAWRILKRHVLADLRGHNPYPGYPNLWRFLRNQRGYYGRTEEEYRRRLAASPDRWSGARYCRADVAAQAARYGRRVLRVTCGSPEAVARAVADRLAAR
jgi:hypothetical protein